MYTVEITATVPKRHNEVWAGKGKVTSNDISLGIVLLEMLSGKMKGHIGGFSVDNVRFHVNRIHQDENHSCQGNCRTFPRRARQ